MLISLQHPTLVTEIVDLVASGPMMAPCLKTWAGYGLQKTYQD